MKVKWNIYNEVSNRFLFKIVCFGLYYLFKFIYYIYDLILWDFFFQHLTVVLSGL